MKRIKIDTLCICLFSGALFISALISAEAQAEIYKWRDNNGTIRYTDSPPPSNSKLLGRIGYKGAAGGISVMPNAESKSDVLPTAQAGAQGANHQAKGQVAIDNKNTDKKSIDKKNTDKKVADEEKAAELEAQKKQQAELAKSKAANCKAAKISYQTYMQGGRIFRTNEQGEREMLGDQQLQEGAAKAQAEINENC